jgi:hypothetical protein
MFLSEVLWAQGGLPFTWDELSKMEFCTFVEIQPVASQGQGLPWVQTEGNSWFTENFKTAMKRCVWWFIPVIPAT